MIKKILYILCTGLLMACADTTEWDDSFLNGRDKTPISTTALLDMSSPQSRAANNAFANGDVFYAYLRHVTWDGTTAGARTPITVDQAPLLVTFTNQAASVPYTGGNISPIGLNQELELNSTNTTQTTDLVASPTLFWDDMSEGGIGDPNNIRTDGHYLQSYYGYCYNGGTPLVDLNETTKETGEIGWQVPYDQTTAEAVQHSDLLWSAEQTPVAYQHGTGSGAADGHGTILLPFTHALSMVTVDVIADDGFDANALANTVLELQNVNRKGTFTAPIYSVSDATTDAGEDETKTNGKVKMFKGNVETNAAGKATCTYQAIVVPQTALALAQLFLKVNDVDGNHYILNVTDNMLTGWDAGLVDGKMQPGYNYHLTLTLNKAGIQVVAMLKDWIQVEATGTGIIQFSTDLRNIQPTESHPLVTGTSYYIYESTANDDASYATHATKRKYDEGTWTNAPEIYWQGEGESRYFRGLAIMDGVTLTTPGVPDRAASQGTDLVWATTPKHTGVDNNGVTQTVEEGAAINPRTSEVPLRFEHAMSKVKFVLSTSTGDDAVDLTEAVISIADLYRAGTIDISTGDITPSTPDLFATAHDVQNIVIPQDLTDRRLTITLKDGTKYSVLLTNCVDSVSDTQIGEWERGRSYTYKITLGKEAIQFRAMIKDWNNTEGKGNASLDWD